MNRQTSDEWVARVVAWHNRHPLARRIVPAQVQSMGWVSLPFTATAAARTTATANQPRGRGWRAAFTEKFLPPYSPRRVARWALRHAQEPAPDLAGSPLREILQGSRERKAVVDPASDPAPASDSGPVQVTLWLPTAAIVVGRSQSRVLLAPEAPQQLFGRRLWSRPRLAALAFVVLVSLGTLVAMALPSGVGGAWPLHRDDVPLAQGLPPQPAATPAMADVAASAPAAAAAPVDAPIDAPIDAPVDEPVLALAGPLPDVPARRGSVPLPQRGLLLDEASKAAAREASGAARAARAAAQVTTAAVAYAVAAPRVRSQAESELMRAALQAAIARAAPRPACRVEALPAGDDWRVVCWPFLHRQDAERLREQLVARGHRLEVIEF